MRSLSTLSALLLCVAPSAGDAQEPVRPRVVVVKTISLEPFEVALGELVRSLEPDMDVRVLSLAPDEPESLETLRSQAADVIVPIGTQATGWVAAGTEATPIVFSMVLDPVSGGLMPSLGKPGGRITGAVLDIPIATQFRTMRKLLNVERVAVLFNPERSGHIVEAGRREARRLGIELVPLEINSRSEFRAALQRVDASFDALWSVPDTFVFSRRLAQEILLHTIRERIPLIGFSEQHVRAGALYSLVSSYREHGQQTARLVRQVLEGKSPGELALMRPRQLEVVFNTRTAENLRVRLTRSSYQLGLRPAR